MQWLKHAFAVESEKSMAPTDEQRAVVDMLCRQIVRRRLTTPALLFLEMSRPLNYLGAQAMHFFTPLVSAVADAAATEHFARFLERRGSIDFLCRRIEELESRAAGRDGGDGCDASIGGSGQPESASPKVENGAGDHAGSPRVSGDRPTSTDFDR